MGVVRHSGFGVKVPASKVVKIEPINKFIGLLEEKMGKGACNKFRNKMNIDLGKRTKPTFKDEYIICNFYINGIIVKVKAENPSVELLDFIPLKDDTHNDWETNLKKLINKLHELGILNLYEYNK